MSGDRDDLALPFAKLTTELVERGLLAVLGKHHQYIAALGARDARHHQHCVCVMNCQSAKQCQALSKCLGGNAILTDAETKHFRRAIHQSRDLVQRADIVDQTRHLLRARLALPQRYCERLLNGSASRSCGGFDRRVATTARDRLADRIFQIGVALEAQLLTELDDARLTDL